jgi:hypothetical protein
MVKLFEEEIHIMQLFYTNQSIRNVRDISNATHDRPIPSIGTYFNIISICKRKHSKYSSIISSNYVFKGLAFETLGPWCKEAIDFINVIGNRLIAESGDSKSKKFLFERISLAIQRGNAASIRGTFPDSAILSEIFVL